MGNVQGNSSRNQQPRLSSSFQEVATDELLRIRVGAHFLRLKCGEAHPLLIAHITDVQKDDSYSFHIEKGGEAVEYDDVDGTITVITHFQLKAVRCGKEYCLTVRKNYEDQLCPLMATFEPQAGAPSGERSLGGDDTWILMRVPGDRYVMESCQFRDYCLASDEEGQLCLQRVSEARRNKQLTLYPVRRLRPHISR